MLSGLRVVALRLRTDQGWQARFDLDRPVVIVHAPLERGKTSFLDAIAFGLGRNVRFRGVMHEYLREVEVTIRIGTATYVLRRRHLHRSTVTVTDAAGDTVGQFKIRRVAEAPTLSDWLLGELGLQDVLGSVYAVGGRQPDYASAVLPYNYLCQDDIDRFLVMPPTKAAVRVAVLRLLFQLTTPEVQRAVGAVKDGEKDLRRLRDRLRVIEEFLKSSPFRDLAGLDEQVKVLSGQHARAAARLADLQKSAGAAERLDQELAGRIKQAYARWREAEAVLDRLRRRLDRAERDAAGYREALDELTELQMRDPSPLMLQGAIANCPVCQEPVPHQPPERGRCYLCRGRHPGVVQPAELAALQGSLSAAMERVEHLRPQVAHAEREAQQAELKVAGLRHERELATGPDVQPYVGPIRNAAAEYATITAELQALRNERERLLPLQNLREEVVDQTEEQTRRRLTLHELQADLVSPAAFLVQLRDVLRSIFDRIKLPHFTGRVRIDPDTFLPVIDSLDFDQRGGAGRSAVSFAYSLALLVVAQESPGSLLPRLLMIDSPSKNLGANDTDREVADLIYDNMLDYVLNWNDAGAGVRHTDFQIIVADNDRTLKHRGSRTVPRQLRARICYVNLTEGLIQGLIDPHAGLGDRDDSADPGAGGLLHGGDPSVDDTGHDAAVERDGGPGRGSAPDGERGTEPGDDGIEPVVSGPPTT